MTHSWIAFRNWPILPQQKPYNMAHIIWPILYCPYLLIDLDVNLVQLSAPANHRGVFPWILADWLPAKGGQDWRRGRYIEKKICKIIILNDSLFLVLQVKTTIMELEWRLKSGKGLFRIVAIISQKNIHMHEPGPSTMANLRG